MAKNVDLYEQYASYIFRYLFSITHDENISEELTQETFYQAIKNIKNYRGDSSIEVWLCGIAKRLWYKEIQRRQKSINNDEIFNFVADDTNIPQDLENQENRIALYKALQQLSPETKEVIYLRITGNFSFKEIGEILNHTETWARVRFYRGKTELIKIMGGDNDE